MSGRQVRDQRGALLERPETVILSIPRSFREYRQWSLPFNQDVGPGAKGFAVTPFPQNAESTQPADDPPAEAAALENMVRDKVVAICAHGRGQAADDETVREAPVIRGQENSCPPFQGISQVCNSAPLEVSQAED
jgi:hypothetical protein